MVFFVDHYARAAIEMHRRSAPHRPLSVEPGELPAYEMTLVQQQAILRRKLVHPDQDAFLKRADSTHRFANLRQHSEPFAIASPAGERISLEVARQTHPGRNDDVRAFARR